VLRWIQDFLFAGQPTPRTSPARRKARRKPGAPTVASARYEAMTRRMLERHSVRVRRWRRSMSGVAWVVESTDGCVSRLIEAPLPKSPVSAAVFLHEIGHHAIGLGTYKLRCLEEFHAWRFALEAMREHGIEVTPRVNLRVHASLHYAVAKARRRGLRSLPEELAAYTRPPTREQVKLAGLLRD